MKLKYYAVVIIIIMFLYVGYVIVSNQCHGGSKHKNDCVIVNDGGDNESCIEKCGIGYYVSEEYCVVCQDCMMCYYGCDLEMVDEND